MKVDRHAEFIEKCDRPRSEQRAERMKRALAMSRLAALAQRPLTWELMCEWQTVVLGQAAAFRTTDAFAKDGRECYPMHDWTQSYFLDYLAEANDPKLSVISRATNIYMDICFFHPFPDGNGRAARLALDFVLASAGLTLLSAEPLFLLPRLPEAYSFVEALQSLCGRKAF